MLTIFALIGAGVIVGCFLPPDPRVHRWWWWWL